MRTIWKMGVFALLAASTPPVAVHAQATTSARQAWEYLLLLEDDQRANQQLNEAGAQGWELVSVVCTAHDGGATSLCYYYFKRPK